MSWDDKLVWWSQVLYAENIDLKRNSDFAMTNPISTTSVTTNAKDIFWFINVTEDWWNKRTFWFWEDWVIYWVGWTDDTPDYTSASWNDVLNAIEFNDSTYFMTKWNSISDIYYDKISSDDLYNRTWSLVQWILEAWLRWTVADKYPMYNYLDSFLYIWVGKKVFREDSSWVKTTFTLWTADIVGITQLWWVFRLYQADWRILFWDWISESVDTVININDEIRTVITHLWTDYIIWWASWFYSNFYFMNWYRAELIQKAFDSVVPELPQINRSSKFYYKWEIGDAISYDWQLLIINSDWEDSIHSFWNDRIGFPKWFEQVFYLSPNNIAANSITWVWNSTSNESFYYGYSDATHTAIWNYKADDSTYMRTWSIIFPIFDWWVKTTKKKIREIRIYAKDVSSSNNLTLKAKVDWWAVFSTIQDITEDWRTVIYNALDSFYDIVFQIDWDVDWAATYDNIPKFYELQVIYDIIQD